MLYGELSPLYIDSRASEPATRADRVLDIPPSLRTAASRLHRQTHGASKQRRLPGAEHPPDASPPIEHNDVHHGVQPRKVDDVLPHRGGRVHDGPELHVRDHTQEMRADGRNAALHVRMAANAADCSYEGDHCGSAGT